MAMTITAKYWDRLVTLSQYGDPVYVFDSVEEAVDFHGHLNEVTVQRTYRRPDGSDDDREEFFELVPYYVDDTHLVTKDTISGEDDRWAIQGNPKDGVWHLDTDSQDLSFCHLADYNGDTYGFFVKTADLVS